MAVTAYAHVTQEARGETRAFLLKGEPEQIADAVHDIVLHAVSFGGTRRLIVVPVHPIAVKDLQEAETT